MGTFEIFSTSPLWINRKFTLFQKKKWNSGEYLGIEGVSCADIAQLTCDIALCSLCVGIQLPNAAQLSRYKDLQICAFLRCFWQLKKQNHNKYPFYHVQIQAPTYILIVHQGYYFKQIPSHSIISASKLLDDQFDSERISLVFSSMTFLVL